jgi:DNA invertase Pin-like site-specific DNA recombinase
MIADHTPIPAAPAPAVGYIRVSMAREEMVSPELQRTAIEAKARQDGATITEWIEELDISGRGFGRKGVQRAIQLVHEGTVRRVYVWKYSRFGRNATLVGVNVDKMEQAGGRGALVSATEHVDASTAVGKFTRGMLWRIDEFQSDVIGEQWQETHARRRKNGLPHSGAPRFGYLYHRPTIPSVSSCPQGCGPGQCKAGYVKDPATEDACAWRWEAYNAGWSVLKIAVELNRRGFLTIAGKAWDQRTVRRDMDSGFAAGLLRIHDPACDCGRPATKCQRKVLIRGAHPPLVDEETWAEYLRQRKARQSLPPRVETPVYPLSGLMRCASCGGPMNTHPKTDRARVYHPGYLYQCATYIKSRGCKGSWLARHRAEDVALAWLHLVAGDATVRGKAARKIAEVHDAAAADRKRLAAEAQDLDSALTNLTVQLAREVIAHGEYSAARDQLRARRTEVGAALEELAAAEARSGEPPREIAAALCEKWDVLPAHGKRPMLAKLIDRIEVTSLGRGKARIGIASAWGEVYVYDI